MLGKSVGHYVVVERLGQGGMGVVYKAHDTHLDRFVALKVLPPEKVADAERKRRFTQEAKAASALNHPNIVHIYDIANDGGIDYIAMELVEGRTLSEIIGSRGMRAGQVLKIWSPGGGCAGEIACGRHCPSGFEAGQHHGHRRRPDQGARFRTCEIGGNFDR